jgi:hypothetical protein
VIYLLDLLIFQLTFPYILEYTRIYFHLHDFCMGYSPQIELVEFFAQVKWYILLFQLTHMGPLTPSVDYYICFPRVVLNSKIIIHDKL